MRSYAEIFKNVEKKTDVEGIREYKVSHEKILPAVFTRALNGDKARDKKKRIGVC